MNARSAAVAESAVEPVPSPPRPFYWSVRRELWENRSIYWGPLAVAAALLLGFLLSTLHLPAEMRKLPNLSPAAQHEQVMRPYSAAAGLPVLAAFLVGAFYCLDALYGERRDRSILFFKSLPVSDRTTVLSKASVPLVVLPLLTYPIVVVTQLLMLLASCAVLLANGLSLALLWERLPLFQMWLAELYALVAIALWHAPVYSFLLLVSAWARRTPLLYAVLPLLATGLFEHVAFGTAYLGSLIRHRLTGWYTLGFHPHTPGSPPGEPLADLSPERFLSTPGLWLGLLFAAACLAAAVRLRRHREPI